MNLFLIHVTMEKILAIFVINKMLKFPTSNRKINTHTKMEIYLTEFRILISITLIIQ